MCIITCLACHEHMHLYTIAVELFPDNDVMQDNNQVEGLGIFIMHIYVNSLFLCFVSECTDRPLCSFKLYGHNLDKEVRDNEQTDQVVALLSCLCSEGSN